MKVPPQPYTLLVYQSVKDECDGISAKEQPLEYSEMREWWRWHFAVQIAAALSAEMPYGMTKVGRKQWAEVVIGRTDALIAALESEESEP